MGTGPMKTPKHQLQKTMNHRLMRMIWHRLAVYQIVPFEDRS